MKAVLILLALLLTASPAPVQAMPQNARDPRTRKIQHPSGFKYLFAAERARPNDACSTNTADQATGTSNDWKKKAGVLGPSAEPHP